MEGNEFLRKVHTLPAAVACASNISQALGMGAMGEFGSARHLRRWKIPRRNWARDFFGACAAIWELHPATC